MLNFADAECAFYRVEYLLGVSWDYFFAAAEGCYFLRQLLVGHIVVAHEPVLQEANRGVRRECVRYALDVSLPQPPMLILGFVLYGLLLPGLTLGDNPPALLIECRKRLQYRHRVDSAVELAVLAALEALEEEHELRELVVGVTVKHHRGGFGNLCRTQLPFTPCKLR